MSMGKEKLHGNCVAGMIPEDDAGSKVLTDGCHLAESPFTHDGCIGKLFAAWVSTSFNAESPEKETMHK